MHIHSPLYIHHTSMLRPSKQYIKTRLIWIHITWSDLTDVCTCGGYLCSSRAAHPRAMCYKCYNESIPSHTRLALNEFQASCYSHHRSQSALSETNWLLRASGCNPYLESLPSYTDGVPSWYPLTWITHWHRPNIIIQPSNTHHANIYSLGQPLKPIPFMFEVKLIPIHHTPSMNIEFQLITLPWHFNTNHFINIPCQTHYP